MSIIVERHPALSLLEQLKVTVEDGLSQQRKDKEMIKGLSVDLNAYKTALERLEERSSELNELKTKLRESRVAILIDGDGYIFTEELLSEGRAGGMKAARILSSAIRDSLSLTCPNAIINVTIFYNKRGLFSALNKKGMGHSLEDFAVGVNQASERCIMVDVGPEKEAADHKIRGLMDDTLKDMRTYKVFFGGCHDNGYTSFLQSLITDGFGDKIVLLQGYTEMAVGMQYLNLPTFSIPNLFMKEKITNSPKFTHATATNGHAMNPPSATVTTASRANSPVQSYSHALLKSPPSAPATLRTASPPSPSRLKKRRPSVGIPLSQQKPPPCTLFYLAAGSCKNGTSCQYGHDYDLEEHHLEEMQANAKKGPCPTTNRGEICTWGANCVYGHKCPQGRSCYYFSQGICKFKHPSMHAKD